MRISCRLMRFLSDYRSHYDITITLHSNTTRTNLCIKACLPILGKRQRDYQFFLYILTLNLGAATRQKPCDIKELYLYNFYHFIARYQKMFEITLTTGMRQWSFDCYDIIKQSVYFTQACKCYIAAIAGNRRPV